MNLAFLSSMSDISGFVLSSPYERSGVLDDSLPATSRISFTSVFETVFFLSTLGH
jgi:hypothetical protein